MTRSRPDVVPTAPPMHPGRRSPGTTHAGRTRARRRPRRAGSARRTRALRSAVLVLALLAGPGVVSASVAEYRLTFDATWSATTHPSAYPAGAHFSSLVGGTHDASVSFWQLGGLASDGIELMAESGQSAPLLAEVQTAIDAGSAWSTISASGVPSPGVRQTTFFISSSHDRATVVTMVAPSPDWFVGVSGLALRSGDVWLDDVVVALPALDAGTDDGVDFTSPNDDTNPAEPIAGFSGPPFASTPPLGTFTFELLGVVYACSDGLDDDGDGLVDLDDPGCSDATDDSERSPALVCDDGLDNDGDTLVDAEDAGCADPLDDSERSTRQCDDGLDNDGDEAIDYPADPECFGASDDDESVLEAMLVPGLGAGAVVLLAAALIGAATARFGVRAA